MPKNVVDADYDVKVTSYMPENVVDADDAVRSASVTSYTPENVVDADDAVRTRRATVVNDGGVALYPNPASVLDQQAVVLGGHLTFHQN